MRLRNVLSLLLAIKLICDVGALKNGLAVEAESIEQLDLNLDLDGREYYDGDGDEEDFNLRGEGKKRGDDPYCRSCTNCATCTGYRTMPGTGRRLINITFSTCFDQNDATLYSTTMGWACSGYEVASCGAGTGGDGGSSPDGDGEICSFENGVSWMVLAVSPSIGTVTVQYQHTAYEGNVDCSQEPGCCIPSLSGGECAISSDSASTVCSQNISISDCPRSCKKDSDCTQLNGPCKKGSCDSNLGYCVPVPKAKGTKCASSGSYAPCDATCYCDGQNTTCPATPKPSVGYMLVCDDSSLYACSNPSITLALTPKTPSGRRQQGGGSSTPAPPVTDTVWLFGNCTLGKLTSTNSAPWPSCYPRNPNSFDCKLTNLCPSGTVPKEYVLGTFDPNSGEWTCSERVALDKNAPTPSQGACFA